MLFYNQFDKFHNLQLILLMPSLYSSLSVYLYVHSLGYAGNAYHSSLQTSCNKEKKFYNNDSRKFLKQQYGRNITTFILILLIFNVL
jgi:hypothetical protein